MFKKLLTVITMVLLSSQVALAQSGSVTGQVTDAESGEALPGVNVLIEQSQQGAATDIDGEFEITNVEPGTYTVSASYIGYEMFETSVEVGESAVTVDIALTPSMSALDDVIVTAFGVSREQKSLGYSVQDVSSEDISRVDQDNIVGALSGKVAGVQVVGSNSLGGSERIRIRGANGLSDGQPLFVVDGTPIDNSSFNIGGTSTGRDLGNLASDIDLSSVENVSVLKGAAASALYGNRAANGVIVITTKRAEMGEDQPIRVDYSNSTYFERPYILPEYQNEYAGGYTQSLIEYEDPADGQTYSGLNYAADESWGPRMEGQMYRPWWSWYDHDFDGDGESDYGQEVPLEPQSDNIENFFDTGVRISNRLSISGGGQNASFRAGISNSSRSGVLPNSELDKTALNFNGALSHSDKFTSRVSFNYVNTQSEGRPAVGYSPTQGNPVQSMNQWFQRQLDMDKLRQYRADDGTIMSWNIRSNTNLRPLYWDSPYFTTFENVSEVDRDRIYGNYNLSYNVNDNIELIGKLHLDTYSFTAEDRIGSGGLEEDWYYVSQRSRREVNYEAGARYEEDFQNFSFSGYVGGNILTQDFNQVIQETVGGLSTPNFFNIDASINRPDVSNFNEQKVVRSLFSTATVGYKDMLYLDGSLRNDWSSALPSDNNSYLYYGLSGSFVFTELDAFPSQGILSFGKLRASVAQVGNDLDPYRVVESLNSGTPYGTSPSQTIPNTLANPDLEPAISSDYEFGIDLRFLDGRVSTDVNYFNSVRENEILALEVPGSSGYDESLVNAGKFTTTGWEVAVGATPVQTRDLNVEVDVNWSSSKSVVDELADGIESRLLEQAAFGVELYADEGEEWGRAVVGSGYGGYAEDENGNRIVNSDGTYALEPGKDLGNILPDWNGGLNLNVNYKNFSLGTFFEFQKGGKFYSVTRMFNAYSGLGKETVGDNTLGNPLRDPITDSNGNSTFIDSEGEEASYSSMPLGDAGDESGGVLVEGVDEDGNEVAYLRQADLYFIDQFYNKEAWIEDASYIKLREVKLSYNIPGEYLERLPLSRATVALDMQNPLLIYSNTDGVDPSAIQNNANGFGFWEGGGMPGTRTIGFNVNLGF